MKTHRSRVSSAWCEDPDLSRRHCISAAAGALATAAWGNTFAVTGSPAESGLIFRDLDRFREAYAQTKRGTSAQAAMEWYLNGATEGLKAYLKAYDVTAADLAARLSSHPELYAELANILDRVVSHRAEILLAARRLRLLAPKLPDVPMYFFVGAMGHGATVKEVTPQGGEHGLGVLLPVELVVVSQAETAGLQERRQTPLPLDNLPQFTTHELAHAAQVQYQGLERYRVIYRDKGRGTHLAYAIREGGADFLCQLATGRLRRRHRYLLEQEAQLWHEFSTLLDEPAGAHRGWFSGRNEQRPERPAQLGYAIGWSICRCYYDHARDKTGALREILSANEVADFERIAAPYRRVFGRIERSRAIAPEPSSPQG